jgi:endothelin-converting enzyme/putative endopeptidase
MHMKHNGWSMRLIPGQILTGAVMTVAVSVTGLAQAPAAEKPQEIYLPTPGFDLSSIDATVNPCDDFYKFTCGKYAANHPIPADQASVNQFYSIYNVNTQELSGILAKAAAGGAGRTADEQKIGDYYSACMDVKAIEAKGLAPAAPLLVEIDAVTDRAQFPALLGKLQRMGVDVFFGYGEQQDFKDATKQIATAALDCRSATTTCARVKKISSCAISTSPTWRRCWCWREALRPKPTRMPMR